MTTSPSLLPKQMAASIIADIIPIVTERCRLAFEKLLTHGDVPNAEQVAIDFDAGVMEALAVAALERREKITGKGAL